MLVRTLALTVLALTVLALTVLASPLLAQSAAHDTPRSSYEVGVTGSTGDSVARIQAHLGDVITHLESRDVAHLPAVVQARRRAQIEELARYADAGCFPINRTHLQRTPIFIDADDTACAVGHLMRMSGAEELARRIAADSNFAYVPEITTPGAAEWMEFVGLTAEECTLIQPAYDPCGGPGQVASGTNSCAATTPNSFGVDAHIVGYGTDEVAINNFFLVICGLPGETVGYVLNSRDLGSPVPPGTSQGTLCLSGAVGRHVNNIFTSTPYSLGWLAGFQADLQQMPTPTGLVQVLAGDTWHFQAWYRDANPTPTSNLSNVLSVTFR